ncbi:polysaccharide deacetylase family protein [Bradyrhizobium sp. RDT10]
MFDLTLTFDNGPEPGVTPRVLDILREHGIKTTFFVIGEKLGDPERYRLAARAHDEGHWIGNHTLRTRCRSGSNGIRKRHSTRSAGRRMRSATSRTPIAGSGRSAAGAISTIGC